MGDGEKTYPFDPDYCMVSRADLANVLTVYEEHTPVEVRQHCPWYLACRDAVARGPKAEGAGRD